MMKSVIAFCLLGAAAAFAPSAQSNGGRWTCSVTVVVIAELQGMSVASISGHPMVPL